MEEGIEKTARQVADHVASVENPLVRGRIADQFYEIMSNREFIPSSEKEDVGHGIICIRRMVKDVGLDEHEIDWNRLARTIEIAVRFLDNVIDVTRYTDTDPSEQQVAKRPIHLDMTGLADLLITLRVPYGSKEAFELVEKLTRFKRDVSFGASVGLAIEKGSFPSFDKEGFMQSKTFKLLSPVSQDMIEIYGLRNTLSVNESGNAHGTEGVQA